MAEPTGATPEEVALVISPQYDEAAARRTADKIAKDRQDLGKKLTADQQKQYAEDLRKFEDTLKSKESKIKEHYNTIKKANQEMYDAGTRSAQKYYDTLSAANRKQKEELETLGRSQQQTQGKMREFLGGATTGLGIGGAVAGLTTVAGFLAGLVAALEKIYSFQRQILTLGAMAGGRPGMMAPEDITKLTQQFGPLGLTSERIMGIAGPMAATRQVGPGQLAGLTTAAITQGFGMGMTPEIVGRSFARMLETGMQPDELKGTFQELWDITGKASGGMETMVENFLQLNQALRPLGFRTNQITGLLRDFGEELRTGKISPQTVATVAGGLAGAPLGSLAFVASRIAERPELQKFVSPETLKGLRGAGSAFELGAVMRQAAFTGEGGQGALQLARELAKSIAPAMGATGQSEIFGRMLRTLMPSLPEMRPDTLRGLFTGELAKVPEEFKKGKQEQSYDHIRQMAEKLADTHTVLQDIEKILRSFFLTVASGLMFMVGKVTGRPGAEKMEAFAAEQFDEMLTAMGIEAPPGWEMGRAPLADAAQVFARHAPEARAAMEAREQYLAKVQAGGYIPPEHIPPQHISEELARRMGVSPTVAATKSEVVIHIPELKQHLRFIIDHVKRELSLEKMKEAP